MGLLDSLSLALRWSPDELYRVPTDDGSAIALGRYRPRGERRFEQPVILCHGLGANRFDLDFDERLSVARFLARRGFETWVLELRGRGAAGRADASTFDDQAEHDVSAALKTVLSTGATGVLWVGHSKGALLAYAHLARHPEAPIRAVVALGTPLRFDAQPGLGWLLKAAAPALELKVLPLRLLTRPVALWGLPPAPIGRYLANPDNMDPRVIRQAIYNVTADVLGGVARQFTRWVHTGRFDDEQGLDYRQRLKAIRAPLLLVAGSEDKLAPPATVRLAETLVSGPVTVLELPGYGHGDLTLGRHAPVDVFEPLARFLEQHAHRASPPDFG